MTTAEDERSQFERIIHEHYQFLADSGMAALGTEQIGDPPGRDGAFIARFEDSRGQITIAWNSFELSFPIGLIFNNDMLSRSERCVFFDPLVEFLTGGREKALVPYFAPNLSLRSLKRLIAKRKVIFATGLEPVAEQLGQKLQRHLEEVRSISVEQIKAYHAWFDSIR